MERNLKSPAVAGRAPHDAAFHEAIAQEVVWKHPEMQRFAVELVQRALEMGSVSAVGGPADMGRRGSTAPPEFTTDIVPDDVRGDGHGIAGSVIELLKNAHVIEPVGVMVSGEWFPRRVRSTRPGCKSRYLSMYRITSTALAKEFLSRNGVAKRDEFVEQELGLHELHELTPI